MAGLKTCPNFVQLTLQDVVIKRTLSAAKLLIFMLSPLVLLTIYDMCKAVDRGPLTTTISTGMPGGAINILRPL